MRRWGLAAAATAGATLLVLLFFVPRARAHHPAQAVPGPAADGAETLVFAQEGSNLTTYWLTDAENPSVRKRLLSVSHESSRSGSASLSPDGRSLAYTVLPTGSADPDHQAELWLLGIGGGARRLDSSVDLASFLVWSPDSASVTFERIARSGIELWRQTANGRPAALLQQAEPGQVFVPVGYDREGTSLILARLGPAGTDVLRMSPSGAMVLSHASSASGRDFVTSADRGHLAFLAAIGASGQTIYEAQEVDLANGSSERVNQPGTEDVGLAWKPDGSLTIGGVGQTAGLRTADGAAVFPASGSGFEQPLAWSPSGARLAVRQFSGNDTAAPGVARDLVIEPDGRRRSLTAVDPVRFVGWVGK